MITVALPVIKTKFFRDALESALNQSYKDFELIIVDNGSPENVKDIVDNYHDDRIKFIRHEKNLPIIQNWNRCLSYATGEYFVLFSDDDIYEKDFLLELNTLVVKYPNVDIFHTRVKVINEDNEVIFYTASCPEYETVADFIWHRVKSYRMHYAPDFMCRTETLKKIGGFVNLPNAWGSDDATWFLVANKNGIVASSKALCNWRQSNINLTQKGSLESKLVAIEAFKKWLLDFLDIKINIKEDELKLFNEIKENFNQRIGVQHALALKLSVGLGVMAFPRLIYFWIKLKKKYSLSFFALGWAAMLLIKDSNFKKKVL